MFTIICTSFCRQLRLNKAMIAMLLCGLIISSFCISVMLGLAIGQYHLSTGGNVYATLTIDPGETTAQCVDELTRYASEIADAGVANLICLTPLSKDYILIGWKGTGGDYWFPITSGTFFSQYDQQNSAKVAFVSDSYQKEHMNSTCITIGMQDYTIIGSGWIVPYNFVSAISSYSDVQIFDEIEGENLQEPSVSIIPLECYLQEFVPTQILLHFTSATYSQLSDYAKLLTQRFPDSSVYLPDLNSDSILNQNQTFYGGLGLLLCGIAGITIILLMSEWIELYRKELYVYYLCGMTKLKCAVLLYSHWLMLVFIGATIAVSIHYLLFPILTYVNADYPPQIYIFVKTILLFYLATVVCSVRTAMRKFMFSGKGEVI